MLYINFKFIDNIQVEQLKIDMEWQSGPDVGNNQSVISKDERNDNPVIRYHQQPLL